MRTALIGVCLLLFAVEASARDATHVLILNSYHHGFEWTDEQVAAAEEVLRREFDDLELHVEYMDTKRVFNEPYLQLLRGTMRQKYADVPLDAIVATDDNALNFLVRFNDELFGGAPVVFCGINDFCEDRLKGKTNYTGVVEVLDVEATIDLALDLHPATRRIIVVVDDTPTGLGHRKDVAEAAKRYGHLRFSFLRGEDYSAAELLDTLGSLPDDSLVLLTVFMRDKNNAYLPDDEGGRLISSRSSVPVYGLIDMYLGDGIVGGKLLDSHTHGRTAAEMAARILRGTDPADIPVQMSSKNPYMFDYRQLERWGIDPEQLPDGSLVGHRPYSFYAENQRLIWGVTAAFVVLVTVIVVLVANIALRRRAEGALRQSEQRYRLLAETARDVIWTMDLNFRRTYVSPAVTLLRGVSVEEAMRERLDEICTPSSAEVARQVLGEELARASVAPDKPLPSRTIELEVYRKDGTTVWTEINVSMMRDDSGNPAGILGVTRDISERKQAEEELRRAKEAAEEASRAKSSFLANMSHEIRTPMTAILGYVDLIGEGCPRQCDYSTQELASHASVIDQNAKELLNIIDDILDLSKIEAGKLDVEAISCSPLAIAGGVVELMQVRARAKGLALRMDCEGPVPERIGTDPTRLRQILVNLVGNAVKFTEVGTVSVTLHLERSDDGTGLLQFRVADTGIGMTADQMKNLFSPFSQADTSTTRKFGGTGLGLTIGKRLAKMLGGDIQVDSTPGQGTTFVLSVATGALDGVPLLAGPPETNCDKVAPADKTGPTRLPTPCRILLVEDGPDNQRLISLVLRKAGADVTLADNGQVAVERVEVATAEGTAFDLILMDMQMPVMDGYEATRQLRADGHTGPIIALTAHAMAGDREACLAAGCDDYLTKPIRREVLLETLRRFLEPAGHSPGSGSPDSGSLDSGSPSSAVGNHVDGSPGS